ncbi:hypothetical protein FRC06_010140 [Ceratobasidium sp. 370]|nr:hypothetical protein FRC06_010140 [Ceratobasidium sp. 370]
MRSYIVVFKESATKAEIDEYISRVTESGGDAIPCLINVRDINAPLGGKIKYHYDTLMKAIAATIPDSLVQSFRQEKGAIDFIEPDGIATAQGGGGVF